MTFHACDSYLLKKHSTSKKLSLFNGIKWDKLTPKCHVLLGFSVFSSNFVCS